MIKLWEKCEIAKVAVKRGVQNTNSELMAEELKRLTGGVLLSRDRECIVFYRGKDFLPLAVSNAIEERRKNAVLGERNGSYSAASSSIGKSLKSEDETKEMKHATDNRVEEKLASVTTQIDAELSSALQKKDEAEKELAELAKNVESKEPSVDLEAITKEERYMLKKLGLRMKAFLLLGRRGVFDGTVENIHLHWKYRELIKIICNERNVEEVHKAARLLELESRGILIAVERVNRGHAIILYRGKNYVRPSRLRPATLLDKKQAMKRSIEEQRYKSLKLHVLRLGRSIERMKEQVKAEEQATINCPESDKPDFEAPANLKHEADLLAFDSNIQQENWSSHTAGVGHYLESSSELYSLQASRSFHDVAEQNDSFSVLNHPELASFPSNRAEQPEELPVLAHRSSTQELNLQSISTARTLSNKERLLLRRQALKMKKRPVLSVGRSNILTGVAKTILTHFKKHPLAIVNIKGTASGTSVPELISRLEQATQSVLVSREPNKVILYRGWGANEENRRGNSALTNEADVEPSPELLDAMKLELGIVDDFDN